MITDQLPDSEKKQIISPEEKKQAIHPEEKKQTIFPDVKEPIKKKQDEPTMAAIDPAFGMIANGNM